MSVIFATLVGRPLGDYLAVDEQHEATVIIPGRRFGGYLATMCGLIRRYGSKEPTVLLALLRLLETCASVVESESERWTALDEQAHLILEDGERDIAQLADVSQVHAAAALLHQSIGDRCSRAKQTSAPHR
jgi:uncharacterized membrane protein